MPELTKLVVSLGSSGLIVVLALINPTIPRAAIEKPTTKHITDIVTLNSFPNNALFEKEEASHISIAKIAVSIGGGILVSR
jgi:hypothetical protein|tara:strand:+ start:431 stop:673 length:243 start_codon:yes stop_codon:yes gene_type:complete